MTIDAPLHTVIGAGPVGLAVARELATQGAQVRLVTRSGRAAVPGAEGLAADVMTPEGARAALKGAAVAYLCASPAYHRWPQEFPRLQANVLAAAEAEGAVLVAASNLYDYGVAGRLHEGLPLAARTRKGATRARLTEALLDAHAKGRVRTVTGRAADLLGPEVRQSSLGERLWPVLLAGRPVSWFGDPDAPHSVTYAPDFARALVRLGATEAAWGEAWHVPSPPPLSPREVLGRAAALAGLPAPRIRRTPALVLRLVGLAVPAAGEVVEMGYSYDRPFVMDQGKWDRVFGVPATSWDEALSATVASVARPGRRGGRGRLRGPRGVRGLTRLGTHRDLTPAAGARAGRGCATRPRA
jgi:nucleoside-diphosphate-sugar epimerase